MLRPDGGYPEPPLGRHGGRGRQAAAVEAPLQREAAQLGRDPLEAAAEVDRGPGPGHELAGGGEALLRGCGGGNDRKKDCFLKKYEGFLLLRIFEMELNQKGRSVQQHARLGRNYSKKKNRNFYF